MPLGRRATTAPGHVVPAELRSGTHAAVILFGMLAFVILSPLLTVASAHGAGEGNVLRQLVYLLLFGAALLTSGVATHPRRLLSPPTSVLLTLAWCCASITWAIDPDIAARRLLLTIMVVFSLFLLVQRAGYDLTVTTIRRLLPLILAANFIAVMGWPGWAIHQSADVGDLSIVGAWRGVLMHKNYAGPACAYTIIFYTLDGQQIPRALRLAVIAAAGTFLYHTHSKSSMGFVFGSVLVALLFTRYNPFYRAIAAVFLALVLSVSGALTYLHWDRLVAPFQDDQFLTGRVQIWPFLIEYWKDHWLLGSGYGSFWNVRDPQPISQYTAGWMAKVGSGHNGYIDLLVQTGLPGLLLAAAATIVVPLRTFLTSRSLDRSRGGLLLACTLFSITHNLTESSVFDRDATPHVFLMIALALLGAESYAREPARSMLRATHV